MSSKPTFEQAQLHLQLYDLRREARLRQARDWFMKNFYADTIEEAMKLSAPGTENGALFMMVISYWDQACAFLNSGLLHEDLFFETTGEFFGVWERVKATVPGARKMFMNKDFLGNLEKAAENYETWMEKRNPGNIENMRKWMNSMRPPKAAA
jgi:hypothetical protein